MRTQNCNMIWFILALTVLVFSQALILPSQAQTGSSTNTGSMVFGQQCPLAFLLPNGKVLLTGGYTDGSIQNNNGFAGSQLYDPSIGEWTAAPMTAIPGFQPPQFATYTTLTNGQLLVIGLLNGTDSGVSEIFDPNSGTWTNTAPMIALPTSGGQTATLLPNGQVLVTGGSTDGSEILLSTVQIYDPNAGMWKTNGNLLTPRAFHSATLLPNGKVLIAGGGTYSAAYSTSAEIYDPGFGTATPINLSKVTKQPSGAVQIDFANAPGADFTALATTNLMLPSSNWTKLGAVPEIFSGIYQFTDWQTTNLPQRFYRVSSP